MVHMMTNLENKYGENGLCKPCISVNVLLGFKMRIAENNSINFRYSNIAMNIHPFIRVLPIKTSIYIKPFVGDLWLGVSEKAEM